MNVGHFQYTFNTRDENLKEILIAELSAIGFDGFEETTEGLIAYISSPVYETTAVDAIINNHHIVFDKKFVPEQNWNALWESNFQPVIIGNEVGIRADFHPSFKNISHEIIITPKMSFGTGHHATTHMMVESMCRLDFKNKSVFDFGTGTGLLAILAEKLGASSVTAIDNDFWSIENARENISRNNCGKIELTLGNKPSPGKKYDLVLANINRNVIIENFSLIVNSMRQHSLLVLSGLMPEDKNNILQTAVSFHLTLTHELTHQNWILLQFLRN